MSVKGGCLTNWRTLIVLSEGAGGERKVFFPYITDMRRLSYTELHL